MQLMHEMRPKPFHDDLETKLTHSFCPKLIKNFWVKTLAVKKNWGFQIFVDFMISWGPLDELKPKTCNLKLGP
jgi:hypothetical protein